MKTAIYLNVFAAGGSVINYAVNGYPLALTVAVVSSFCAACLLGLSLMKRP